MEQKQMGYESTFDIDKVSFKNVSDKFEKNFRKEYENSLKMMSDSKDPLKNASGASSLGVLEKMARDIGRYDAESDFKSSYHDVLKEFEPYTET